MSKAILLSAASTHSVFTGSGTYYGLTAQPAAGGTVIVSDLANVGHNPDMNDSSWGVVSLGGTTVALPPAAYVGGPAVRIVNGLNVSFTSTKNVTVHYDE